MAHAEAVVDEALQHHNQVLARWTGRLEQVGLPALDPGRFQTWQTDRERIQKADLDLRELQAEAQTEAGRRDVARAAICKASGISDPGGELAPLLIAAENSRFSMEQVAQNIRVVEAELEQIEADTLALDRRQQRLEADKTLNATHWSEALSQAKLRIDVSTCDVVLGLLDELREATALEAQLRRRIDGITRDTREHAAKVTRVSNVLGLKPADTAADVRKLRERLAAAREAAALDKALLDEDTRRESEASEAQAKLDAADHALIPMLSDTHTTDRAQLLAAIERSRSVRVLRDDIARLEREIVAAGDGLSLDELLVVIAASEPDSISFQVENLNAKLQVINSNADEAATAHGDARRAFLALEVETTSAVQAAADAAQARSELETLAEHYILKRAEAVSLQWAIEKYRERNQNPLLVRAGELFSMLTNGRYVALRVEADGASPRLLGLRDDGRTVVEVDAMSEGTTDQLFLALRLAGVEQSVSAGINLPFLADDLFVNFDDERAEAGFRVLADVAKSTQVLFFTHHPHLAAIAKSVVGPALHSECRLM